MELTDRQGRLLEHVLRESGSHSVQPTVELGCVVDAILYQALSVLKLLRCMTRTTVAMRPVQRS